MKNFKQTVSEIYQNERGLLIVMVLNIVLALVLLVFSLIKLNPNAAVVKIGYGDIGGYRDGTWMDMLAFPLLAVIFGVLHNLLALKIFQKRGGGMTKFFLIITATLILGSFLALIRLLGEA